MLIREDEKQRAQSRLEAFLLEGLEIGEATDFTQDVWKQMRAEALRQLIETRKETTK